MSSGYTHLEFRRDSADPSLATQIGGAAYGQLVAILTAEHFVVSLRVKNRRATHLNLSAMMRLSAMQQKT